MKESSNNAVTLIILAVALSALFAVMHFSDGSSNSAQLFSGTKGGTAKTINLNTSGADMYSDNLSGYQAKKTSGTDRSASGINLPASAAAPSAVIAQADIQSVPQKQVASANANAASNYIQTNSKTFKTSSADMLALQQNVPKSDINATIKARTVEVAPVTPTKKGTPAAAKKGPQKGKNNDMDGGPGGQPGLSLPIGDGTWMLLLMVGMYATRKMSKQPTLKESVIS